MNNYTTKEGELNKNRPERERLRGKLVKDFILVNQISKKNKGIIPRLIAVKEIISISEIDGSTYIETERDHRGCVLVGIEVEENFHFLCNLLQEK